MRRRRWAYLGNHQPGVPNPWSTETHLASSIELCGHEVTRIQEGEVRAVDVPDLVKGHDIFLHTQTYGLAVSGGTVEERYEMLTRIKDLGIPTVGFHLDLWFGLDRSDQLATEPFFRVDHLFSADGDHDAEFRSYNINHHWLPPGVYGPECYYGRSRSEFMSDVAFVGSWQGHYHKESTHRFELVDWLRRNIPRRRVRFWPAPGSRAVRCADLNDLYASVKVVVGDSCFPHGHTGLYMSDRVMETPGRGGLLIHPSTPGVTLTQPDMPTWPIWDWNALGVSIDYLLTHEKEREERRRTVHEHTRANHTYENRVEEIVANLQAAGVL